MELSAYIITWQIFWLLAAALSFYAMSNKCDKRLKSYSVISNLSFIVHYFMLSNGIVWAIMNILWLFKSYFWIKQNKYIAIILIICYITLGIYFYNGFLFIIPVFAGIISTIGLFYFHWVSTRLFIMLDSTIWLFYNYWVFSIGWVIQEVWLLFILGYNIYMHWNEIKKINT